MCSPTSSLLEGRQAPSGFSIARFKNNHHPIAAKLKEIKEILICHFTADSARVDMLNSLLFDIVICERDLIAHCRVEDSLFIPAIEALENQAASAPAPATGDTAPAASTGLDANGDILLTPANATSSPPSPAVFQTKKSPTAFSYPYTPLRPTAATSAPNSTSIQPQA